MVKKSALICIDRDGTILFDDNHFLGSQKNWKSLFKIMPGVVRGITILNRIERSKVYMISSQSGVAIQNFELLDEVRANETCLYTLNVLKKKGVRIDGYEICTKVNQRYVKEHKEFVFDKQRVGNFLCVKPNPGMIFKVLERENLCKDQVNIYVIGNKIEDVLTGIHAGGFGILVPFLNSSVSIKKLAKIDQKKFYLAKDFYDACKWIYEHEQNLS